MLFLTSPKAFAGVPMHDFVFTKPNILSPKPPLLLDDVAFMLCIENFCGFVITLPVRIPNGKGLYKSSY